MPLWVVALGRYAGGVIVFCIAAAMAGAALVPTLQVHAWIAAQTSAAWAVFAMPFLFALWGWLLVLEMVLFRYAIFYKLEEGERGLFTWSAARWLIMGYLSLFVNKVFLWAWKGTPFLNWYLRLMGATIGKNVNINTVDVYDWGLITLDDGAILGGDCVVIGHLLEAGKIKLRPVHIGKGALIGTRANISPGVTVGDGAIVGAMSIVTKGTRIEAGTVWGGVPAKFLKMRTEKEASGLATAPATATS